MTQKKDITHPVYVRESKRTVQLFEREEKTEMPKYHSNSNAMWVATKGILFAYILLKIIHSNLSF